MSRPAPGARAIAVPFGAAAPALLFGRNSLRFQSIGKNPRHLAPLARNLLYPVVEETGLIWYQPIGRKRARAFDRAEALEETRA